MKKAILLSLILSALALTVKAQEYGPEYNTAVGIKFYPGALSVKHFTNSNTAIEGLGYFWEYGYRIAGLYELHYKIGGVPGLKWYFGPGAHVGYYNDNWTRDYPERNGGFNLGVDGVLGLDYKIQGAPIDLSLDWQPSFTVLGSTRFESGWGGLAVRFAF